MKPPYVGQVFEIGGVRQHFEHLERVRLPVGGEAQHAAVRQARGGERGERRLDEAPLVVALLGPGIGEQDQELVEEAARDLLLEHLDRVVADEAHVAERRLLQPEQQPADTRAVHLDADEVALRVRRGERQQVLAVAEADLQGARRLAAEQGPGAERLRRELHPVFRPQLPECAFLGLGDAPGAGHEGADGAGMLGLAHARLILARLAAPPAPPAERCERGAPRSGISAR